MLFSSCCAEYRVGDVVLLVCVGRTMRSDLETFHRAESKGTMPKLEFLLWAVT